MLSCYVCRGRLLRITVEFIALAILLLADGAGAATLTVCSSGCTYASIQAAINASSTGDIIEVQSGTYYENVDVSKSLTLKGIDTGSGNPVVDARSNGSAITLSAGNSTLEGFITTGSAFIDDAGILVKSNNNILKSNTASNNRYGISLWPSSSNNTLSNNTASNNRYGISLSFSSNNTLSKNNASNNSYYGISFVYSSNNTLSNNIASNNSNGISLSFSSNNTLSGNTASNNSNGISLSFSSNNTLSNNTASNNSNGIYLGYSSNNTLSNNTASNTSYGIWLFGSSNNTIYNNLFNNTYNFYIYTSINRWSTTKTASTNIIGGSYLGGNFWANPSGTGFSQTCTDNNGDGICDSSYVLDSSNIDYLPLAYPYKTHTVVINLSGIPVVSQSTKDILSVDYWNFNTSDPYNISITKMEDSSVVYINNGTLKGLRRETIPINWTPLDTRQYLVEARGNTTVSNKIITVYDSEVISPVPELSTIVLTSTGLLGLLGFARQRRRN